MCKWKSRQKLGLKDIYYSVAGVHLASPVWYFHTIVTVPVLVALLVDLSSCLLGRWWWSRTFIHYKWYYRENEMSFSHSSLFLDLISVSPSSSLIVSPPFLPLLPPRISPSLSSWHESIPAPAQTAFVLSRDQEWKFLFQKVAEK